MKLILNLLLLFTVCLFSSCTNDSDSTGEKDPVVDPGIHEPNPGATTSPNVIALDFDNISYEVRSTHCTFSIVDNPDGKGKCGQVKHDKVGEYDCVDFNFVRPLDFTRNPALITMKVRGSKANARVRIKLVSLLRGAPTLEPAFLEVLTTKKDKWEELAFDFSKLSPQSNWYNKLIIYFNVGIEGKTKDELWYFDDITIPDDDLSPICLFKRAAGQRPPKPDASIKWISNSTANPDIMSPSESIDGNWWLFMRGGNGVNATLGVYTQEAASFNPLGPWKYYSENPVIPNGFYGDEDCLSAIDPGAVKGKDGKVYLFYKGESNKKSLGNGNYPSILLAISRNGFKYEKAEKPWLPGAGMSDVVFDGNRYYLFAPNRVYAFDDPLAGAEEAKLYSNILKAGDGPSNFDSYSINAERICRLDGVDKWFMFYQGSPCHADFPVRFHVALSDDLIHWKKVKNEQPLFSRGDRGSWDQGAIWYPAVFEHDGTLYMYYEGWGRTGFVADRDKAYFSPAHSEIGIATCKKEDFLRWCGLIK